MRTPAILQFLGSNFAQVNADGPTSTSGPAACPSSLDSGQGSAGTGGGGKKGDGGGKNGGGGGKGRPGS